MATIINTIRQQYPGADQWQQQFPWFSLGHLLQAEAEKNTESFGVASQKAAVYFNDVQRLHWLLTQQDIDIASILADYDLEKEIAAGIEPKVAARFAPDVVEPLVIADLNPADHQPPQINITGNAGSNSDTDTKELQLAIYEIALNESKDFSDTNTGYNDRVSQGNFTGTGEEELADRKAKQETLDNEVVTETAPITPLKDGMPIAPLDFTTEAMVENASVITENIIDHPTKETTITQAATDGGKYTAIPADDTVITETTEVITVKEQEEIMEPADASIVTTGQETVVGHSYEPAPPTARADLPEDIENAENVLVTPNDEEPTFVQDELDTVVEDIFVRHEKETETAFSMQESDDITDEAVSVNATSNSLSNPNIAVELEEAIEMPKSWEDDTYDPDDTDGPEDSEAREPELLSVTDIAEDTFESTALSQSLAEVSKHFKEDVPTDELEIASEPYHTVDYFASQGIKLELEPKADDKFGQQLKSFTSWLKQMKRLPAIKQGDREPDKTVDNIAASSLQDGEVLTESMAEVLLKQGKEEQAVEVWQKLSLLHPEKSHYFAALIEKTKV